jgi:hypothetical protein
MIKRPFEKWDFEEVEKEFGLTPIKQLSVLVKWLDVPNKIIISPFQEELRISMEENVETWNEDELKTLFIAPFLLTFKFNNPPLYRVFTQRQFKIQTPTIEASGKVEWFVSTGKQKPQKPFFFLQEYKPARYAGSDPLGQLLIAMVEAQIQNEILQTPIYGCYMVGRMWFFVVLVGKEYGVSGSYDATKTDDLNAMIYILERVREHIHKELNLPYSFPF